MSQGVAAVYSWQTPELLRYEFSAFARPRKERTDAGAPPMALKTLVTIGVGPNAADIREVLSKESGTF